MEVTEGGGLSACDWELLISLTVVVVLGVWLFWLVVVRNSTGVTLGQRLEGWLSAVGEVVWSS